MWFDCSYEIIAFFRGKIHQPDVVTLYTPSRISAMPASWTGEKGSPRKMTPAATEITGMMFSERELRCGAAEGARPVMTETFRQKDRKTDHILIFRPSHKHKMSLHPLQSSNVHTNCGPLCKPWFSSFMICFFRRVLYSTNLTCTLYIVTNNLPI